MIYVTSNIHGNMRRFQSILDLTYLQTDDTLLRHGFLLHLLNQNRRFCLCFYLVGAQTFWEICLPWSSLGEVYFISEVVVDLVEAADSALAAFEQSWLEVAGLNTGIFFLRRHGCIGVPNLAFYRRCYLLHLAGDVLVNFQRICPENVPNVRRQDLYILPCSSAIVAKV